MSTVEESVRLHQLYHGHSNPSLPYSLVVRYGTTGIVRQRTEDMLRAHVKAPFQTKAMAEDAKHRLDPALRPFVAIDKFTEE